MKPVAFSTSPKPATARIGAQKAEARAVFTVTAANVDDSVTGILVFTLSEEARQTIAQISGKELSSITTGIVNKDVKAVFKKGTSCPIAHFEISQTGESGPSGQIEVEAAGVKLVFNRLVLDINETDEKMSQLFCSWARQINAGRQRRGIIAAINRLLIGE